VMVVMTVLIAGLMRMDMIVVMMVIVHGPARMCCSWF